MPSAGQLAQRVLNSPQFPLLPQRLGACRGLLGGLRRATSRATDFAGDCVEASMQHAGRMAARVRGSTGNEDGRLKDVSPDGAPVS